MTTSVSPTGNELAMIRRLRTAAVARCAHSRMEPHRRDLLRDALVTEAERRWGPETEAAVIQLPRQRPGHARESATA